MRCLWLPCMKCLRLPCMRYQMLSCIRCQMLPCMRLLRLPCIRSQILCRVGQSCIHTLTMTVRLVTFLPTTPYIHRLNMVLADPILVWTSYLVIRNLTVHIRLWSPQSALNAPQSVFNALQSNLYASRILIT